MIYDSNEAVLSFGASEKGRGIIQVESCQLPRKDTSSKTRMVVHEQGPKSSKSKRRLVR
jgi:hypothetical protein